MSFIEIKAGGPEIAPGTYHVILTEISDPRTVLAQRGPRAGEEVDLIDWKFAIDAPGNQYDGLEVITSSSTRSGPKSKLFAYLTALFGGVQPPIGTKLEKNQLIGRPAVATIAKDDEGWLRITNLSAVPVSKGAAPAPAPVAAPALVAAAPAAQTSQDLPF